MKRSTKVVLLVIGAVVALGVVLRVGTVAKAASLGVPLATSVKLSMGQTPSCAEQAAMSLAIAERRCRAAGRECARPEEDEALRLQFLSNCLAMGGRP